MDKKLLGGYIHQKIENSNSDGNLASDYKSLYGNTVTIFAILLFCGEAERENEVTRYLQRLSYFIHCMTEHKSAFKLYMN